MTEKWEEMRVNSGQGFFWKQGLFASKETFYVFDKVSAKEFNLWIDLALLGSVPRNKIVLFSEDKKRKKEFSFSLHFAQIIGALNNNKNNKKT